MNYKQMLSYALIGAQTCIVVSQKEGNSVEELQHLDNLKDLETTYEVYSKKK